MQAFDRVRLVAERDGIQGARELLELVLEDGIEGASDHFEAARVAIELGMTRVALRELNLTLRDHPSHIGALSELANLHADRGDDERELAAREQLAALGGAPDENSVRIEHLRVPRGLRVSPETSAADPDIDRELDARTTDPLLGASDADVIRFLHLFSGREGVHARQWYHPGKGLGYSPIHQPLTPSLVRAHLEGVITIGAYPARFDGTVTYLVLDLDITRAAIDRARGDLERTRLLRRLVHRRALMMSAMASERFGLDLLLEDSGYKGRHLWCFLGSPVSLSLAHRAAVALAGALAPPEEELQVEAFPRQSRIEDGGLGNLIKLPLGIHLRSSRRAMLLDQQGRRVPDPWPALQRVHRHPKDTLLDILDLCREHVVLEQTPRTPESSFPAPAPMNPRAPFTEVDLEIDPVVSTLLGRCAVLDHLAKGALERRRLTHEERTVIRHTLGHIPAAIPAANYLFERCPEIERADFLKSPLQGHPMSCPKIRKKIPDVTSMLPCHCAFPTRPEHYPSPVLHIDEAVARGALDEARAAAPAREPLFEEMARSWASLRERISRLEEERDLVRGHLVDVLSGLPDRSLALAEGTWQLVDEEGLPVLLFEPVASRDAIDNAEEE